MLALPDPSSGCIATRGLAEPSCVSGPRTWVLISTCQEHTQASASQKYSLFSSGQMLPLIRLLPLCHPFDGTEAFVELLEM